MTAGTENTEQNVLREIRKLVIDCCRQNGSGHGGSAIGMAAIGTALWGNVLRFDPQKPDWFDRDRFVLSNGHVGLLQYTMLHLAGYRSIGMDDLKNYANDGLKGQETECHGHPEIETPGVEITTGPLGQGVANAVGMAVANRHLRARFNKDGEPNVINSRIYCTVGDACLQEGVGLEAVTIAGHLKLDNLTVIYDNNGVICDGPLDWVSSEDMSEKMRATGFHVIEVFDGVDNVESVVNALKLSQTYTGKPTFINIRTTIGYKTSRENSAKAHHGTYTDDDLSVYANGDTATHTISQATYDYFKPHVDRNVQEEREWEKRIEEFYSKHPKEAKGLKNFISGKFEYDESVLDAPSKPLDGLKVNHTGLAAEIFEKLVQQDQTSGVLAGGADLWGACKLKQQESTTFQPGNYAGNTVRYGVREHAMASISNGISAYQPGAFVPITATFLMFYLYAAPGVRMSALCNLKSIHIAAHDSINEGQNGPTHQPVEVDSLFRSMPNVRFLRPSSSEEVYAAWRLALQPDNKTYIMSVSREAICDVPNTDRKKALKGGYVVVDNKNAKVTLVSTGAELGIAYQAVQKLQNSGVPARLVSMPCLDLFREQDESYQDEVLSTEQVISLEPYVGNAWATIATAAIGMQSFGWSSSGLGNYKRFKLDTESVVGKVHAHLANPSKRFKLL